MKFNPFFKRIHILFGIIFLPFRGLNGYCTKPNVSFFKEENKIK